MKNVIAIRRRAAARAPRRTKGATSQRSRGTSLTQQAYERLRIEILTCVLEPGATFTEGDLAERFKMSKTPVREALGALRVEGLVQAFPQRGYQVVPITLGDLRDLFDIRTIVEVGNAELASQRITPEEVENLYSLVDVHYDSREQRSLKDFIAANRGFHGAIAKASCNERLYELVLRQIDALVARLPARNRIDELRLVLHLAARMSVSERGGGERLHLLRVAGDHRSGQFVHRIVYRAFIGYARPCARACAGSGQRHQQFLHRLHSS